MEPAAAVPPLTPPADQTTSLLEESLACAENWTAPPSAVVGAAGVTVMFCACSIPEENANKLGITSA